MAYSLDHLIEREWGDKVTDPVKFEIKCVEKICCEQIYHGKNPCDGGKPFILTQVKRSTNVYKLGRRYEATVLWMFLEWNIKWFSKVFI